MERDFKEKYQEWLNSPIIDEGTKEELRGICFCLVADFIAVIICLFMHNSAKE